MAVKKCCISNCNSSTLRREDKGVTFHKFPKDKELYLNWLNLSKVDAETCMPAYVCSRHFRKHDYKHYKDSKYILKSGTLSNLCCM